ncbi:hypothetical protein [Gemmata sp.]|uniref:hypothetical protein n=1 Tax=Gemmata sp. TaxID=1914242 RepID=UPI003F721FC9
MVWALLAQARPDPFREPEVIWGTAGIAVALLAGAFVIWLVDKWRKNAAAPPDATEELSGFRGMLQRGEITEEEYARLRNKVAARVRDAVARAGDGVATGATGTAGAAAGPPDPLPPVPPGDGSRGPPV